MSIPRIKRNDTVVAIAGADAGKTGKVLDVLPRRGRAIVEGLGIVKKALRKTEATPEGGIVERERALDLSNVMPYCPSCKKGVRVGHDRGGKTVTRVCRGCGHAFDH